MSGLTLSFAPLTQFIMENPAVRLSQGGLILLTALIIFLLFFALRDILLRTHSFWYQFVCIVIVALLPIVGFLIYLLIRPARTIKQRETEAMLLTILATDAPGQIAVGALEELISKDDNDDDEEEDAPSITDAGEEDDEDDSDVVSPKSL